MKRIFAAFLLLALAQPAFAKKNNSNSKANRNIAQAMNANFGVFTTEGKLYVTALGDACNTADFTLDVSKSCQSDRTTRNATPVCQANLAISQTEMPCTDYAPVAHVGIIDLKAHKVDKNAKVMEVTSAGQNVRFVIHRKAGEFDFSAFTSKGVLYITMLGDSCNGLSAELTVADSCKKGRLTRNGAPVCNVELGVISTAAACSDTSSIPKTMTVKLADTEVDPNSIILNLKHGKTTKQISINR